MKRTVVLLSIVGLLVMGLAGTALAVVTDTPHNITNARGVCNNCHVPHLAGGARLWPQSEAASPIRGIVGPLCYSCHDGTIATSTNISLTAWAINTTPTTAAGGSHGLNRTATGAAVSYTMPNTVVSSTLPYGDGTATKVFECSTCHDPHNDGTAPWRQTLLRVPIEGLCQACHTARGSSTAAWVGYGAGNTLGTHPVGTNVTGDSDAPANSPIDIGVGVAGGASDLDQPYAAGTPARHQLGGHLNGGTTNGGVVCTTCHAPHGSVDVPTAGYIVGEDLLAIPQDNMAVAAATSGDGFSANGGAGSALNDPLCEGCHGLAASTWNPGNTSFSHPADAQQGVVTTNLANIPSGWPYSSHVNSNAGVGNAPNCESCHKAHGATVNSHILRATEATICDQCHASTIAFPGHHPIGTALMTNSNMADTTIGNNDGDLTCTDCHNGAGAHNWPAAGMPGLDNDWLPPQNGRTNAAYVIPGTGNLTNPLVIADTSRTCWNCHTSSNARQAPTRYSANDNATAYGEYQDMGDGTHFLGTYTVAWANGELMGAAFNATLGRWPWPAVIGTQPAGWVGGFSRFGGTTSAPEIVCESCHSLRPTWNDQYLLANRATSSLLLYDSIENRDEAQSQFCQACHGHDPGVATPHPMTADNVTKAWDAGRTPNTLLTFGQTGTGPNSTTINSYMNANALNHTWIPGTINRTNCNSCHQPHDSNTRHGTWILELDVNETPTGTLPARSGSLYGAAYNIDGNTTPVSFTPLCLDCHTY